MARTFDLSRVAWKVAGFIPDSWRLPDTMEVGGAPDADVPAIPAPVPGSVQQALRAGGLLPDWNVGLNARACEWVENRHWIYQATIPDEFVSNGSRFTVEFLGLDYCG